MNNLSLYLASVFIWGSTWIVITFQYGSVAPEVSVAYRFWLAALMLMAWSAVTKSRLRFTLKEHAWLALQGALLFGINYVCVYRAEQHIASGLTAVIFSIMVFLNILGARAFFATPMALKALLGATLGVTGVAIICWPGTGKSLGSGMVATGISLALCATVSASLGNLVSQRNQKHGLPVVQGNAFSMFYGATLVGLFCWALHKPFALDTSFRYLGSLAYLALFGSVLAFGSYLKLVGRIGAGRAGYTMVAIPMVALLISTFFEGLRWEWSLALGVALCIGGNVLVLAPTAVRKPGPEPA